MPNGAPKNVITLTVTNGQLNVNPPNATINRNVQTVFWNLVPPGSFQNPPVAFANNQPGYDNWPGTAPAPGPGNNQWSANANSPVPMGQPAKKYKYNVLWSGGVLDPDIENQPYPPGMEDDDDQGDQDKGPHHKQP